jgi:predicted transcriptional regulator
MLRAVADREEYGEKEIKYRPTHEIGTRLAKQLYKLVKYLAVVAGRKKVNEEDYALMERVAFDTSEKIHYEILEAIFIKGGKATAKEIVDHIGLSLSLVWRNLQDMTLVKVVDKIQEKGKGIGRPSVFWSVSTRIKELWKLAEIDRNIISKKIVIKKR